MHSERYNFAFQMAMTYPAQSKVNAVNISIHDISPLCMPKKQIHLWVWDLNQIQIFNAKDLNDKECSRMQAMRSDLKKKYLNAHAILKRILHRYFPENGILPRDLPIQLNEHGKPFLTGQYAHLQFNLAHTENYAALLVAWEQPVGVDVENIKRKYHPAIAEKFFSATEIEYYKIAEEEERASLFYSIWTKKEALVKAIGRGIAHGAWASFSVNPNMPSQEIFHDHITWKLLGFVLHNKYQVAAAFPTGMELFTCYDLIHGVEIKLFHDGIFIS